MSSKTQIKILIISLSILISLAWLCYVPKRQQIPEEKNYFKDIEVVNDDIVDGNYVLLLNNASIKNNYMVKVTSKYGDEVYDNYITLQAGQSGVIIQPLEHRGPNLVNNDIVAHKYLIDDGDLSMLSAKAIVDDDLVYINIYNTGERIKAPLRCVMLYFDKSFNIVDFTELNIGSNDFIIDHNKEINYIIDKSKKDFDVYTLYINFK